MLVSLWFCRLVYGQFVLVYKIFTMENNCQTEMNKITFRNEPSYHIKRHRHRHIYDIQLQLTAAKIKMADLRHLQIWYSNTVKKIVLFFQALFAFSVYCMLVLVSFRFLKMVSKIIDN